MISISFAIDSILSDPPSLKSRVTLLHTNVSARQSPTFPTIKPIKFVPSEYCDVDRKKDQKRPHQNHALKTYSFFYNALIGWCYDYPYNAQFITLADDKSGTMLLKGLKKTGSAENKG